MKAIVGIKALSALLTGNSSNQRNFSAAAGNIEKFEILAPAIATPLAAGQHFGARVIFITSFTK
ncbi:hypothetical protein [Microbulbifer hainanensis]|uniref:hypothetical protein n=1 Tax=Microbulbifer hainanensis TaxID=2735675 RepID=UPI0018660CA0|nr:hypothetical protein [Microbulbifer hainanensis]